MATYTYVKSAEHNIYPNLTVYDRLRDGVPVGWQVNANKGYILNDKNAKDKKHDACRLVPSTYNWADFAIVATEEKEEV